MLPGKHFTVSEVFRSRKTMAWLVAILVLAVGADYAMTRMLSRQYRLDQEVFVTLELGAFRARLEERINTNLYLIRGMAANISVRPGMTAREFEDLASVLMGQINSLRNIAAAPDFVIRFIHPLEGNEKALGLDYRTVPDQWPKALEAKETGEMALAGPLKLVQGGLGLVARVPVHVYGSGQFWGLVSAAMDLPALLELADAGALSERVDLAIRGRDGKGGEGDVFHGDAKLFDPRGRIGRHARLPAVRVVACGGRAQRRLGGGLAVRLGGSRLRPAAGRRRLPRPAPEQPEPHVPHGKREPFARHEPGQS